MTIDPKRDYYAILGVSPAAEDVVIKAAYKALMQGTSGLQEYRQLCEGSLTNYSF
jgi:DnaJ-domain-containing protein 1